MRDKYCSNCYYGDKCGNPNACKDYTPFIEEDINEEVNDMIENNRRTFRAEWFEYIEDCNS